MDQNQLPTPIGIGARVAQEWIDVTPGHYTGDELSDLAERIGAAIQDERDQLCAMVADLEAALADCCPQWIPISERTPPEGKIVPVLTGKKWMLDGLYLQKIVAGRWYPEFSKPTHWYQLPPEPTEG